MLYRLDEDDIERSVRMEIRSAQHFGLREESIENFLKSRLGEIVSEDQLMLIGQERRWQEEADLLALDKTGTLYIFELKRHEANPENLLQVMRYGQIFGRYAYEELEQLARRQQQLQGSLKASHKEYFELNVELSESDFNTDQVFVLVTNGMDRDTISAVNYWSQKGVRIECAPYRIYEIGEQPYIQFDTYNPEHQTFHEENAKIFIVNTNRQYMPDEWNEMLKDGSDGFASAYEQRRYSIDRISEGNVVYLYHTGVGIIAKGRAVGSCQRSESIFSFPLRFEWALLEERTWTNAPRAWEINGRLGASNRFRGTVLEISQDMARAIDEIYSEHRQEEQGQDNLLP